MDIGVPDDSLNGIPIDESDEEEEEEEEEIEGEDADLVRAKRVQKEKPFHFTQMHDVKSKWENVDQTDRDERREERKQEIQSIRNRLFMVSRCESKEYVLYFVSYFQGKQGKMKEMYQQAVMESESGGKGRKSPESIEVSDTRSIKERFEKGEVYSEDQPIKEKETEDLSVFENGKQFSWFFIYHTFTNTTPTFLPPNCWGRFILPYNGAITSLNFKKELRLFKIPFENLIILFYSCRHKQEVPLNFLGTRRERPEKPAAVADVAHENREGQHQESSRRK